MTAQTDPTMLDLMEAHFRNAQAGHHGPMFGEVVSYDYGTQAADVQPLVRLPVDGVFVNAPILRSLRVQWPGGGGGALTFPLAAGDVGELAPMGADFSNWIASGTKNQDAATGERFQLASCVFKPLYRPFSSPLPAGCVHATCPVLSGDPLLLGDSTATELVALAALVLARLTTLQSAHDLHKHTGVTPGVGTSAIPDVIVGALDPVAATKVRAK